MNINFTDKELDAIQTLAAKKELTPEALIRLALRTYQAVANGEATLNWQNQLPPLSKLPPALSKLHQWAQEKAGLVPVYVPTPDSWLRRTIKKGSGIVGQDSGVADTTHVYYEGNLYGAVNIVTFEDKLYTAWGRMSRRYPTVAQANVPNENLIQVGWFDTQAKTFQVLGEDEKKLLDDWVK